MNAEFFRKIRENEPGFQYFRLFYVFDHGRYTLIWNTLRNILLMVLVNIDESGVSQHRKTALQEYPKKSLFEFFLHILKNGLFISNRHEINFLLSYRQKKIF